jgi:NADP-dependent 3-hydroxy acid dehydrogenase YdfG
MDSNQKVAVVTGAGGTLCSEMARDLARQGYKVALLGRNLDKLSLVEAQIKAAGGIAVSISTDVSDENSVKAARDIIELELGLWALND